MIIKPQVINTKRLELKNLRENDLNRMHILFNDKLIKATYMIKDFSCGEEEQKFFHKLIEVSSKEDRFVYGIYLKDELIGFLNDCCIIGDEIELGYFIDPMHWNKGYASEALTAAIDTLFNLGYQKVIAGYFEENGASLHVMLKSKMLKVDKEEIIEYKSVKHRCLYTEIKNPKTKF